MKSFAPTLLIAALFTSIGAAATYFAITPEDTEEKVVVESLPTVERVTEIGELCVLKLKLSDMLEAKSPTLKASWFIAGDALISVDLREARIEHLDRDSKQIVLKMPPLHVVSPRVDHTKTRSWDIESVCWHDGWFTYDKLGKSQRVQQVAMREAQKMIAEVAQDPEFFTDARSSAEQLISALYNETGYTVSFEWPDTQGYETESMDTLLSAMD
ncbi:MAG: DUF4230 domain-containing protein [Planctomycetaceae bacterium]|jgi:hypothetical protein|nr:DUF4230 domain-containing protein [Planctomycetaceae bacterium]